MSDLGEMIFEQVTAQNKMFKAGHDTGYVLGYKDGAEAMRKEIERTFELAFSGLTFTQKTQDPAEPLALPERK